MKNILTVFFGFMATGIMGSVWAQDIGTDIAIEPVYIGSSGSIDGLKFYHFDNEERSFYQAVQFCKAKGLHLMSGTAARTLINELEADEVKLEKWLNGEKSFKTWMYSFGYFSLAYPVYFLAHTAYFKLYPILRYENYFPVRCVGL